ncbi:MAG: HlyD family efflux transporter periplasmic adaptor subunit [Oscillospiraceae bacterium]|nr:HlyD family efflux transporter periplasmic adaptor subunit [Oscillospiraceae bacterium]
MKDVLEQQGTETLETAPEQTVALDTAQTRELSKKSKKKKGKKRLFLVLALIAVAGLVVVPKLLGSKNSGPVLDLTDTTVLKYTDIESSISATGVVESAKSMTVYSTMNYTVQEVAVKVGDFVEEGQLLAQLDDQNIQDQISSQEISMNQSAASASHQIKVAQENYDNYKSGIDEGLNSSLNSAESQMGSAYDAYKKAEETYERFEEALENGENTTLNNARTTLDNAKNSLNSAETAYNSAKSAYDAAKSAYEQEQVNSGDTAASLAEAEKSLEMAREALADLNKEYEAAKEAESQISSETEVAEGTENPYTGRSSAEILGDILIKEREIADIQEKIAEYKAPVTNAASELAKAESALTSAESQLSAARSAYKSAKANYNATVTTIENTLEDYEDNMGSAWDSYKNAKTSLEVAEKTVNEQLNSYANNVTSAQINANNAVQQESLRQLRATLDDTKITAPCSGTITAVYAEVGKSGSGLLFVIEDVENLIVDTSVKGYDMGEVKTGMDVVISSDATGDQEFEGVITSIAPTSKKNAAGVTDTSGEATFATEVEITSKDTGLRIGMEAQLDYIVAQEANVLTVPYDAVYENEAGENCVIAAIEQENGTYLLKEINVTTGMDDDLDMVISGEKVTEGLRVINEPDTYRTLIGQTLKTGTNASTGMAGFGPAAMMNRGGN